MNNLLEIRNLSRVFKDGVNEISILKDISLDIQEGSFTVIRGSSGAGKTTLLRILGLLDHEFSGSFKYGMDDISNSSPNFRDQIRSEAIGFVFQEGRFLSHRSIGENIALPLKLRGSPNGESDKALKHVSQLVFRTSEISKNILTIRPSQASGGQRQRAALARAMITKPKLILADEPTASLDAASRKHIVEKLLAANEQGATVIVVSHDPIFFDHGDQLELDNGRLVALASNTTLAPPKARTPSETQTQSSDSAALIWQSWAPKLNWRLLIQEASIGLLKRPLLSILTLVSLIAGICQVAIFVSLLGGIDTVIEDAIADGSRLTRIIVRPRNIDLSADDRFPLIDKMQMLPNVQAVIPRRSTSFSIIDSEGTKRPFQTIGLHKNDIELQNFKFIAGTAHRFEESDFNILATPAFLTETFKIENNSNKINWQEMLGKTVLTAIPRFNRAGQQTGEEILTLSISGVLLTGEGTREFYVANTLLLAADMIKRDRTGLLTLPTNSSNANWEKTADLTYLTNWQWQDMLHIHVQNIDAVLPTLSELVSFGYRPEAEIWEYLWVLDLKQAAVQIFIPILVLMGTVISLVLISTIYISAKLRESELALCRVLGMRRGDLLCIELLGIVILTCFAIILGLGAAHMVINVLTAQFEAQADLLSRIPESAAARVSGALFDPIIGFAPQLFAITLILTLAAALFPAVSAARTDPAKIFTRP